MGDEKSENGGFLKRVKLVFYYFGSMLLALIFFVLGMALLVGSAYSSFIQFKTLCYADLVVLFIVLLLSAVCIFIAYGIFEKIFVRLGRKVLS